MSKKVVRLAQERLTQMADESEDQARQERQRADLLTGQAAAARAKAELAELEACGMRKAVGEMELIATPPTEPPIPAPPAEEQP